MRKYLTVKMQDGSVWGVPVIMIAENRAKHYMSEFDNNLKDSMNEDTIPLFESCEYEIKDWAVNNMNWGDFDGHQVKLKDAPPPDFQDAWLSGEKGLSEGGNDGGE